MTYIELPDHGQRDVSFYLSMEEYVAHHVDAADCFFMWQVKPSVIFGRNQVAEGARAVADASTPTWAT